MNSHGLLLFRRGTDRLETLSNGLLVLGVRASTRRVGTEEK